MPRTFYKLAIYVTTISCSPSCQSPLHLAVLTRQKKVMQYLLKANSNPLVCDRDGNTPLHIACRIGFVEGVATLLGRTNHINAEACRIPELNIRNSQGTKRTCPQIMVYTYIMLL